MSGQRHRASNAVAAVSSALLAFGLSLGVAHAQVAPHGMQLSSPAFAPSGPLPHSATCAGAGTSPPLRVEGVPRTARSLALLVEDPDAPHGVFTHWVAWNASPDASTIAANAGGPGGGAEPRGLEQGTNDFGRLGYGGACPPHSVHRYVFHVYALDTPLRLSRGARRVDLERAMRGHVIEQATLTGTVAHSDVARSRR